MGARRGSARMSTGSSVISKVIASGTPSVQGSSQLQSLPEFKELDTLVIQGADCIQAGPAAKSACTRAASNVQRVLDIAQHLPGGAAGPLGRAAFLRGTAVAESCGDAARGKALLQQLVSAARASAGNKGEDMDRRESLERADTAEVFLAAARHELYSAAAGSSGSVSAAAGHLDACKAWAAPASSYLRDAAEAEIAQGTTTVRISDAEAEREAAIFARHLPHLLSVARAHALGVLVARLQGRDALGVLPAPAPPPSPEAGPGGKPHASAAEAAAAMVEAHNAAKEAPLAGFQKEYEASVAYCDAVDSAVNRLVGAATAVTATALAPAARYIHGRTACIRTSARRNLAAAHLLTAAECLAGTAALPPPPPAAKSSNSSNSNGSGSNGNATDAAKSLLPAAALSHVTSAHRVLSEAAAQLDTVTTRLATFALPPPGTPQERTWRRLRGDVARAQAEMAAALSEAGCLMALMNVWSMTPATAPNPANPLFPLSPIDTEAVTPVLAKVTAQAEDSLRQLTAASSASPPLLLCDHGMDTGGGVARALRLLASLQHMGARAVMAEGLLRSALEMLPTGSATPVSAAAALSASSPVPSLPVLSLIPHAQCWSTYGLLLGQWDKREREGAAWMAKSDAVLARAGTALGVPPPRVPGGSPHIQHVASRAYAAALSTAHVGAWAPSLLADLAAL